MKINQIKILYSLFFKSSNLILKLSIGLLPIIIAISFASILFINNLSQSYKNYLLKSYIGTQGALTINAKDINYLQELQNRYKILNINSSKKRTTRRDIILSTKEYNIKKTISIVILEQKYLKDKFQYNNQPIVFNKVLKNILGDISTLSIKNKITNKNIKLKNIKIIDTGFLTSEPLIFISHEFFKKIGFGNINFDSLEVDITLNKIQESKDIAYKIAVEFGSDMYNKDILSSHKQTQTLFKNIKYIEYVVLIITVILAFIILTGALSIISKIKEKAISLLRIYGLSTNLISISLTMLSGLLLLISIVLAYIIFELMKYYFVATVGFDSSFFLLLDNDIVYLLLSIISIFLSITYIWGYNTFKGKINL